MLKVTVSLEGTGEGERLPEAFVNAKADLVHKAQAAPPLAFSSGVVVATYEQVIDLLVNNGVRDAPTELATWWYGLKTAARTSQAAQSK